MWTENLINSDDKIREILKSSKTIAVIGLSNAADAVSYNVTEIMQGMGYKIVPVNPKSPEILGEKCFTAVDQIPTQVDIVNIFRRPEAIVAHAEEILRMKNKPKCVWMQLGIENPVAAEMLAKAGIKVVQDHCIKVEARRLL